MAENSYNITLDNVVARSSDEVYRIDVYVDNLNDTAVTGLVAGDFTINGSKTFALDSSTNGYYTFTTSDFVPAPSDYEYIQVTDGSTYSDKLFIDFMKGYTSSVGTYSYVLPAQTGYYKIGLDKVNDLDFSSVQSSQIRAAEQIVSTDSTIEVYKSYLTHFVGETLGLKVTIVNGDSATLEVSMKANKQ